MTSQLCEAGLMAVVLLKSKDNAKMSVEEEIKVATFNLIPGPESCVVFMTI